MLPNKPAKNEDGKVVHYNDPALDPMWKAIEESGLAAPTSEELR